MNSQLTPTSIPSTDTVRILPTDYGKKRTGMTATDPLQVIANGLATVSTPTLSDYLKDYVACEKVEQIVIGKPVQTNGKLSENMARVEQFINRWRKAIPQIPIGYYDKRFTSVLVHKAMFAGGIGEKARQSKALVDEMSATIILQSYMESRRLR